MQTEQTTKAQAATFAMPGGFAPGEELGFDGKPRSPHRILESGERIRKRDERNDGTKSGGLNNWTFEQVPCGMVGRKADDSLTIRRKIAHPNK